MAAADSAIELDGPPVLAVGAKVRNRHAVRNDGTYPGVPTGTVLVEAGEVGYVNSIGTYLQRYYIYGVDFFRLGCVVGMRGHELETRED
jgi:nitrogen fixation protein NifZ